MAKILLERAGCIGCRSCASLCPAFFEMSPDGFADLKGGKKKKNGDFELETAKPGNADEAAAACPVNVIHVKKK